MKPLIVDANATGMGMKHATLDVIGAGPRTVAGVFEMKGMKTHIKTAEEALKNPSTFSRYDLLLVSGMTTDLFVIKHVISKWRKHSKGLALVGGPVASNPKDVLIKAKGDLAVVGEAEETLVELIDSGIFNNPALFIETLKNIRGVAYVEEDCLKINDLRPMMERRVYDGFSPSTKVIRDYPKYYASRVYVEVLRGCSNYLRAKLGSQPEICVGCKRCTEGRLSERFQCPAGLPPGCGYCSVPSLFGPPKSRSISKIISEIESLFSENVRRIVLSAPDFLDYGRDMLVEPEPLTNPNYPEPNYEYIEELLSTLTSIDIVSKGEVSIIIENLKATLVTDRAAKLLGEFLKGTPVNIGFETGCEEHSRQIGRPSTPSETIKAVARLKKEGLKPYVYFIHGLPGQTRRTAIKSVKAINDCVKVGAERIILYRFQPLPMSAFSGQSMGPPAARDRVSRMIFEASKRANMLMKKALLGNVVRVIVAEPYRKDKRYHVAYPMLHGPVILLERSKSLEGRILDVKIEAVISDRMVKAIPLKESY